MKNCIFCKIINKEIPADVVFENNKVIVFKDINPKSPIHLLIVPKKHIPSINDIEEKDIQIIGELFFIAKKVAEEVGVNNKGYKLVINVGEGGGQEVFHIHLHLLAKL